MRLEALELFSGTKSFSKVLEAKGIVSFTIDNDESLNPDLHENVMALDPDLLNPAGILWASPPCESFSVASISSNWTGGHRRYEPKTERCKEHIAFVEKTIEIISVMNPRYWFIENPRGILRKIIDKMFKDYGITDYVRRTITYCRYGDCRMKPTDIWTNFKEWKPRDMCKNGDSCHESAPRGAKTGTQGIKGRIDRSRIPRELCEEIITTIIAKENKQA